MDVIEKGLFVRIALRVAVNDCRVNEDILFMGLIKESDRVVESVERRVSAEEMEVNEGLVVKVMAVENSVDSEDLAD